MYRCCQYLLNGCNINRLRQVVNDFPGGPTILGLNSVLGRSKGQLASGLSLDFTAFRRRPCRFSRYGSAAVQNYSSCVRNTPVSDGKGTTRGRSRPAYGTPIQPFPVKGKGSEILPNDPSSPLRNGQTPCVRMQSRDGSLAIHYALAPTLNPGPEARNNLMIPCPVPVIFGSR